jgi:hypothetical protein
MQDAEAQNDIEPFVELADIERVHAAVDDLGGDQVSDRVKACPAVELDAKAGLYPVDVLLVVDGDHAPRLLGLGEKAVEAVERADVEDAAPGEAIPIKDAHPIAVIARDAGRVDAGGQREGVKPQRDRIPHRQGVVRRRAQGIEVGDGPLGGRRLRDLLELLNREGLVLQHIASIRSPAIREHRLATT